MKKIAILPLIYLLILSSCNQARVIDNPLYLEATNQSRTIAQKTFTENHFPGLAVAVAVKGKIVWSEGFGFSDLENESKIDPLSTKFRIGSISKSFTSAALGKLYDLQKIDLNVPVQRYVPDFPVKKYPITLKFLAGHTSGIRHYKGSEFLSNEYYATVSEGLEIFKNDPLIFKPGSKYAYSSYGWNLISAAIEGASGQEFLTYMDKAVFGPLKMKNTVAEHSNKNISNKVSYYQLDEEQKIIACPNVDNSYKWAGGGFLSSAGDVVKFAHAFSKPGFLTASTLEKWTSSQRTTDGKLTNYGIGWRSGKDELGKMWYGHSGGSVGGTSMMLIYPEEGLIVITLVNLSSAKMDNLAYKIGAEFMKAGK